jgi:hypothetical protein
MRFGVFLHALHASDSEESDVEVLAASVIEFAVRKQFCWQRSRFQSLLQFFTAPTDAHDDTRRCSLCSPIKVIEDFDCLLNG